MFVKSTRSNTGQNGRLKKELRMIAIEKSNYDKLRELGHVPDSFNDVITRLLLEHDQGQLVAVAAGAGAETK